MLNENASLEFGGRMVKESGDSVEKRRQCRMMERKMRRVEVEEEEPIWRNAPPTDTDKQRVAGQLGFLQVFLAQLSDLDTLRSGPLAGVDNVATMSVIRVLFYHVFKAIFLLYLALPQTRSASSREAMAGGVGARDH
ncbi:hypothetical protein JB92DRAFT_2838397 [Gautieria morchelliformis]|nr:hypothetical protein JB92DRAFT_2838397 [Gautieria morchelliformis]